MLRAIITVPAREVTRLPLASTDPAIMSATFAGYAKARIRVIDENGASCASPAARPIAANAGYIRIEVDVACERAPRQAEYDVLFDLAPSHVHFARFGEELQYEAILSNSRRLIDLATTSSDRTGASFGQYVGLGFLHVISGYDHLAFLLALLLVAESWRRVLLALTGFTVGHSLTLGIALLGVVAPKAPLVEALIGFTVGLVAAEYVALASRHSRSIRIAASGLAAAIGAVALSLRSITFADLPIYLGIGGFTYCYLRLSLQLAGTARHIVLLSIVALAFGLIHGFGFAGFLMGTGIGGESILKPLLGFNLGVEVGQVTAVATALLLVAVYRRLRPRESGGLAAGVLASVLCGVGVYWFVSRSLVSM